MPGAHDEKRIADKYALDYPRRPLATRTWKRRWNWAALLAGIVLGASLYLIQGNAAFWSGPVSSSHASFAMDCQKCHTDSWQPALRLASLNSGRHSVPNAACQECHKVGDHHPRISETEPACANCHQEHRSDTALLAVADSHCTACHGDLNSVPGSELHFAAEINSFDASAQGHPEFAFFRGGDVNQHHGAFLVAGPGTTSQDWLDHGGILFNHKVHLAAEGVLDGQRSNVQLTCADCHELDPDGEYMKPIVYERHCASCHPLRLAETLAALGDLPHETPELVRGAIRERTLKLQTSQSTAANPPVIRRLPAPTVPADNQVDALVAAADHAVFGLEAKGLCRKCHHVEVRDGEWHVPTANPAFTLGGSIESRQMIPDRWFAHGSFDHGRHLTIACTDCHRAVESTLTSDILLPGIDNCRQCHGNAPTKLTQGVAADCTSCHEYHGPTSHGVSALTLHAEAAP
jgi:hypothetical protein